MDGPDLGLTGVSAQFVGDRQQYFADVLGLLRRVPDVEDLGLPVQFAVAQWALWPGTEPKPATASSRRFTTSS
jgi:hypothetical protein